MRLIPSRNPISNIKTRTQRYKREHRVLTEVEYLARLFRFGELTVDDIPPELRNDVTVWLLDHSRNK